MEEICSEGSKMELKRSGAGTSIIGLRPLRLAQNCLYLCIVKIRSSGYYIRMG